MDVAKLKQDVFHEVGLIARLMKNVVRLITTSIFTTPFIPFATSLFEKNQSDELSPQGGILSCPEPEVERFARMTSQLDVE